MHPNRRRINKKKMEVLKKIVIFIAFLGADVCCLTLYASSTSKDKYIAFPPYYTRGSIFIGPESNYSSYEYYLQISWSSFRVDDDMPSCSINYVSVYVGRNSYQESIGKFCSNNAAMPYPIYSWDGHALISYLGYRSGYFEFRYQLKSKSSELLGSLSPPFTNTNLNSSSGVVFSRNWPIYHQSSSCTYTINRPTSYEVTKIAFMDRDFPYDQNHNIEIRGSNISTSKLAHIISSRVYRFQKFIVNDRYIQIKFTWSNRTGDKYDRGFVAGFISYNVTSPPPITRTTTTLYATTFRQHKYFSNSSSGTIFIEPSRSNYLLHWYWSSFRVKGDMPSCTTDYVEVYLTRSYKSIGRLCSNNAPTPFGIFSLDGYAKIIYKASNSSSVKFGLWYKLMSKTYGSKCIQGYGYRGLYSQNWPQPYLPSSLPCRRGIYRRSPYDATKIVFMDLDLQSSASCNDYIELRGSNKSLWNYTIPARIYEHTIDRIRSSSSIKTYTVYDTYIQFKFNRSCGPSSKRGFLLGYIPYVIKKSETKTQSSSSSNLAAKTAIGISAALLIVGIVLFVFIYKCRARVRARNANRFADSAPVSVTQTNITTTTTVFTNADIIGDYDAISYLSSGYPKSTDAIAADAPPSYVAASSYPPSNADLQNGSNPPPPYESTISSTPGENVPVNPSYRAEYREYASGNQDNQTGNQDNETRNQDNHLAANQEYPTYNSTASVTLALPTSRNQWVTFSSHGDQQTPSITPIERNTNTQNEPLPDYDNVPPPAYNFTQN